MRRVTLATLAQQVKGLEADLQRIEGGDAEDARVLSRAAAALARSAAEKRHQVPPRPVPAQAARHGRHRVTC